MNKSDKFRTSILIGWSVLIGWVVALLLLLLGYQIENEQLKKIVLWNVDFFAALAGNGPLLGYDAQGNPMYEGTPVHIFFALIGVLSGFVVYPLIIFIILIAAKKLYLKRNDLHE